MVTDDTARHDSNRLHSNPTATEKSAAARQETVLVIDDDLEFLGAVRRTLIREGWVVHTTANPADGLKFYESSWRDVDLVLLDYFMHVLRGDEVFDRLRRINPNVRVILTTACEEDVSQKMRKGGLYGFVQKPLSSRDLIRQVRAALNHRERSHHAA